MYQYRARIDRVVDGDTVDATVDVGFHATLKLRMRLLGIDTPERGEPGYVEATARLAELVEQHADAEGYLLAETHKSDAFGRWLTSLYRPGSVTCLNEIMLAEGHARPYQRN